MSTPHSVPPNDGGALRIGDTERIAAAAALGDHFAAGRLDQAELDDRLARAYAAKTNADLRPLFADLPDPNPTRPEPAAPAPAWTWSSGAGSASAGSTSAGSAGAGSGPASTGPISTGPAWPRVEWRQPAWMGRGGSPALRIAGAALVALAVMAVLSALFLILPFLLLISLFFWLTGGPLRRHRQWHRTYPMVNRPPWGGDNAAWYQFGRSTGDWSHLTRGGPVRRGRGMHGPAHYAHRHHRRRG